MNIHEPGLYHIYNRGNNQQKIFFNEGNYDYFVDKCRQYIKSVSEIFAWCLMTNHFHFLIEVSEKSLVPVKSGGITMPAITNGFRLLQSSYAKGINKQQDRTGNLFQQKTKAKLVSGKKDYSRTTFFYIHQNPVEAGIVNFARVWPHSSYQEYTRLSSNGLCNTERAERHLNLSALYFQIEILKKLEEDQVKNIF